MITSTFMEESIVYAQRIQQTIFMSSTLVRRSFLFLIQQLDSMQWTQLKQENLFLKSRSRPNGDIYKDQLLILGNSLEPEPQRKVKSTVKSESEAKADALALRDSDYDSDDSEDHDLQKSRLFCWNISKYLFIFPYEPNIFRD